MEIKETPSFSILWLRTHLNAGMLSPLSVVSCSSEWVMSLMSSIGCECGAESLLVWTGGC